MNSPEGVRYLTREQAERFLQEKGTTVFNLLAAAGVTADDEFIRRASTLFPDHPAVQLAMLSIDGLTPEIRKEWTERFKASLPDNPLPLLYATRDAFARKDTAAALAEASLAVEMSGLYYWTSELLEAKKQSYESAGYHPIEAELLAIMVPAPHGGVMHQVGIDLMRLFEQAQKDTEQATAEKALRTIYGLGRMLQSPEGGRMLVAYTVGMGLEAFALNAMPMEVQSEFLARPWSERKAEMLRSVDELQALAKIATAPLQRRDANLLADYLQRFRNEGEHQALLWLKDQIK